MTPKFQAGDRVVANIENYPYKVGQELTIEIAHCPEFWRSFAPRIVCMTNGPKGTRNYFEDTLDPIVLTPFESEVQAYIRKELNNV